MSSDRESWRRSDDETGPRGPNPPAPVDDDGANSRGVWRARWAIVRRELRSLRSEKTILLAVAIQLFIAAFSSFLVVGLVSMYDPGVVDGYESDVAVTGSDAIDVAPVVDSQDGLDATIYEDRADAHRAFDNRWDDAVLDANRDDDGRLVVRVTAPDGGLETTLLVVQLREALETVEYVERVENADRLEEPPLAVPSGADASPYAEFTYTVLLPLLLFLPAFISGSIVVDSLIEERQRGTLELLRVAPLSFVDVVDAKLVATALLAPLQAIAWLALLAINGTAIANPAALIALVSALSVLVVGIGGVVALSAPDRRQAQLLYSSAIVAALVVSTLLPEHPANTVAKFAIGSATGTTWLSLALYCLLGALAFAAVRIALVRVDHESL
ncbi:ABC transporter permease [Natrarchaeobius chitinivorans]|uniref:ABC transporter permease n=1 Tax=Natrarchaeobius chitinivorans TaxID=1679083 RepID=A0A3N6M5R4_NATCH|nr:ABC transporter permease [Natrarchaeobius chitinivorans]RQG95904.1 ABC transporter permease [Natrarchaeobius chitinivorans]